MPELPEVEGYRRLAEGTVIGRVVSGVRASDAWYLKGGLDSGTVTGVLTGCRFVAARRRGKLMLLDAETGDGPSRLVLGLRFGMSGRLVCDGRTSVDRLLYTTGDADPRYERFAVTFSDGGTMAMIDPRRLGGVELDPDEERLGPDALSITAAQLRRALGGSEVSVKARLLDQAHIAGVGNLIADEVLWRAGIAPGRPSSSLSSAELRRLHRHLSSGLGDLMGRGGSHTGDLQPQRRRGGICPKDGAPLSRGTFGGRTSWWCPRHQV